MSTIGSPLGATQREQPRCVARLSVTKLIRTMRGGSRSSLVHCSDGERYILKTYPSCQGPNTLANEALGSCLLRGLGFSTPKATSVALNSEIRISPSLVAEVHRRTRSPRRGPHFASRFFGSPEWQTFDWLSDPDTHRLENRGEFLGVLLFDIWASHRDLRQCVYRVNPETSVKRVFFIDNGHLFGGPNWSEVRNGRLRSIFADACSTQSATEAQIAAWISHFQEKIPQLLREGIQKIPPLWYQGDIRLLETELLARLKALPRLIAREMVIEVT
jgi:hypothetical protein